MSLFDQLIGMTRPFEEGKVALAPKGNVGRHVNKQSAIRRSQPCVAITNVADCLAAVYPVAPFPVLPQRCFLFPYRCRFEYPLARLRRIPSTPSFPRTGIHRPPQ